MVHVAVLLQEERLHLRSGDSGTGRSSRAGVVRHAAPGIDAAARSRSRGIHERTIRVAAAAAPRPVFADLSPQYDERTMRAVSYTHLTLPTTPYV